MSMSLAPSPTAMVRASGTPAAVAKRASAAALPARSTSSPESSPVSTPPSSTSDIGRQMVDAQVPHQRLDYLGESAAHDGDLVPEPLERAHQRAGARLQGGCSRRTATRSASVKTRQEPHPAAQRVGEIELARHRRLGDGRHLRAATAAFGQQVDHLALQQG